MSAIYRKLSEIILSVLLIGIIAFIIYTFNKGYDFTDEGFYLLYGNPFQAVDHSIHNYDVLFKIAYKFFGVEFGITGLRLLRLLCTLAASSFFAASIIRLSKKHSMSLPLSSLNIYLLIVFFSFSSYTLYPHSISYNTLMLTFSLFAVGALLFTETTSPAKNYFYYFFIGICIVGLFLCKPPGGAIMAGIIVVYSGWRAFFKKEIKQNIFYIIALSAGILITDGVLAYFYPRTGLLTMIKTISEYSEMDKTHSGVQLLYNFFAQIAQLFECFVVGWIVSFLCHRYRSHLFRLALTGASLIIPLIITRFYTPGTYSAFIPLGVFYLLGFEGYRAGRLPEEDMYYRTIVILLLLAIPLSNTIGTNALIVNNLTVHAVYFLTALLFFPKSSIFKWWMQLAIAGAFAVMILLNFMYYPFRQRPLAQQTEPITYKNKTHYVDKESKQYIDEILAVYDSLHIASADQRYGFNISDIPGDVAIAGALYPQNVFFAKEQLPMYKKYFLSKELQPDQLVVMITQEVDPIILDDYRSIYNVHYIKELIHPYEGIHVKIFYLQKK